MSEHEIMAFYTEYYSIIDDPNGDQRDGQALMNALAKVRPDLYRELSDTEADCFYIDERIGRFMVALGLKPLT